MLPRLFILALLAADVITVLSLPADTANSTSANDNSSRHPILSDTRCSPGTFISVNDTDSTEYCSPCPRGHFWTTGDHRSNSCLPCYQPIHRDEAEVVPCSPTFDTVVACRENYFLQESAPTSRCQPCSGCRGNVTDSGCPNVCCSEKGNRSLTIDGRTFLLCRGPDRDEDDDANSWRLAFIMGVIVLGLMTVLVCLWRVTIRSRRKPGKTSCLRRKTSKYERGNSFTDYL